VRENRNIKAAGIFPPLLCGSTILKNSEDRAYYDEVSSLGVCIDWFGPYANFSDFKSDIEAEPSKYKYIYYAEDEQGLAQYIGITEDPSTRFINHHTLANEGCDQYWYGAINSQGKSGKRTKSGNVKPSAPLDLDQAETALINWLWPELNDRKTQSRPKQTISIANRFFTHDEVKPRRGPEALPRILFYDWISDRYTVLHD
jgi:hypothetical protein